MSDALNELRKKYFAEAAANPNAPKVFHIFTRQPYVAEPEKPKRTRKPKVDKQAVELLEELLGEMKAGKLMGAAVVTWSVQDKRIDNHVVLPAGRDEHEGALMFSGGAMMLTQAIQDVAEFGMEGMTDQSEGEVIVLDGETP